MKANELRIGNLIQDNNKEWIVSAQLIYSVVEGNGYLAGFKPIPLTEEWLVKFGFDKSNENNYLKNEFRIWIEKHNTYFYIIGSYMVICNNVHQLQNLYFALTNTELTINE